jgi:DnaJ homolog subfamily A member 5
VGLWLYLLPFHPAAHFFPLMGPVALPPTRYDDHRDSILRSKERHQAGSGAPVGSQRPEDEEDLYAYFTSACYSGFGDGPRGFYAVYDELFQKLAKQEEKAHTDRADRGGKRAPGPFPRFGSSTAPWEEVSAFYSEWESFVTVKDFSWADEYNPASAPNRKVGRHNFNLV